MNFNQDDMPHCHNMRSPLQTRCLVYQRPSYSHNCLTTCTWLCVVPLLCCRFMRLGTASLAAAAEGGPFIMADKLDLRKYAARPNLARVLCDYILYVVRGLDKRQQRFFLSYLLHSAVVAAINAGRGCSISKQNCVLHMATGVHFLLVLGTQAVPLCLLCDVIWQLVLVQH